MMVSRIKALRYRWRMDCSRAASDPRPGSYEKATTQQLKAAQMKPRLVLALGAGALVCLLLTDCGGEQADTSGLLSNGGNSSTNPLGIPPTVLDTQQVLLLAQKSSETADPFAVDGGVVTVYPTDDETSDPISVDGT
jgi:hypothetical protein